MAEIFLAYERGMEGMERQVAIKRILPSMAEAEDFVTMFMDEARIATRLVHPNIAMVYNFGEEDGLYFLAMEYVEGLTCSKLLRLVRPDPFPIATAFRVVADVCAALHHAHELRDREGKVLGLVHRDVSPQNVMVSRAGVAKLLDFGVARAATQSHATKVGQVKGKIGYIAPEAFRGQRLDRRADLFSVGALLYELIAGTKLFKREIEAATVAAILNDEPPPLAGRFGASPEVDRIIRRAVEKDPDRRYATALEMQQDLEQLMVLGGYVVTPFLVGQFVAKMMARADDQDASGRAATERSGLERAATVRAGLERVATTPDTPASSPPAPDRSKAPSPASQPGPDEIDILPEELVGQDHPDFQPSPDEGAGLAVPATIQGSLLDQNPEEFSEPSAMSDPSMPSAVSEPSMPSALSEPSMPSALSEPSMPSAVSSPKLQHPSFTPEPASDLDELGLVRPRRGSRTAMVAGGALAAVAAIVWLLASTLGGPDAEPAAQRSPDAGALAQVSRPGVEKGDEALATAPLPGVEKGGADAGARDAQAEARDAQADARHEPAPAAPVAMGKLFLHTSPWSKVRVDGHYLGTTPIVNASLPAGSHTLRLTDATGKSHTKQVTIRAGAPTKMFIDLSQ